MDGMGWGGMGWGGMGWDGEEGWKEGRKDGCIWMEGWIDAWMDGLMDGWTDGQLLKIHLYKNIFIYVYMYIYIYLLRGTCMRSNKPCLNRTTRTSELEENFHEASGLWVLSIVRLKFQALLQRQALLQCQF